MQLEQLPLSKQIELVFRTMREELSHLSSGTVFVQIRNNVIGKFGVRHNPLMVQEEGLLDKSESGGLSDMQVQAFRHMAVEALKLKKWSYGEIVYAFELRQQRLSVSISFESNYNLSSLPQAKYGS